MSAVGRLLKGCEPEEGADGGQAQVAGPDARHPVLLEVLEKRTDERRIQIIERRESLRAALLTAPLGKHCREQSCGKKRGRSEVSNEGHGQPRFWATLSRWRHKSRA